jgi:hypothetical protein
MRWVFLGENSDTQWYWPPAVGAIDAISAIEAKTVQYPIQTMKKPQTRPAGPPFNKPKIVDL